MNLSLKNQKHGTHLSGAIPKTLKIVLASVFILCLGSFPAEAQIFKNLGKKVEKAVERGVEKTVERKAQEKTEEKTGEVLDGVLGGKKKKNTNTGTDNNDATTDATGFEGDVMGAIKSGSMSANAGSDIECPVMEVGEVYVGVAAPGVSRRVTPQKDNACGYEISIRGKIIPLTITAHKMSQSQMKKEASNYKNDPSGMLSAQSSISGNVTLGVHKPNRWLMVFDLSSDYVYRFNFSTTAYASVYPDKKMADYETAKKTVIDIANHWLKK
ncbi:hypothetical protein GCM10027051_33300 [Niabella terrae]